MTRFYYDLHIHSCLSPCADDESTPNSILGMGELNGLGIMALTDHNTAKNCPAFFEAAKRYSVVPVAGMELTTAEDIHLVCLFEELSGAMEFDRLVDSYRILIPNRVDIFGNQLVCDQNDEIIGHEDNLLSNATRITIDMAPGLAGDFGGVVYPAHIDREANGLLGVLGLFPPTPEFSCIELHDPEKAPGIIARHRIEDKRLIISSDAHYLWDIKEPREYFELPRGGSPEEIRRYLFEYLKGRA